jgi:hypothetical protein
MDGSSLVEGVESRRTSHVVGRRGGSGKKFPDKIIWSTASVGGPLTLVPGRVASL